MQLIFKNLPNIYKDLLPAEFFEYVPEENLFDCHDCHLCKNYLEKKQKGERYFIPDTKCCTYHPNLPNYLIGAILNSKSENLIEGQNRIRQRIINRIGVTPLFLYPSTNYSIKYKAFAKLVFGKSKEFRCPFFEEKTGNCTVYPYWNSVCSSWFCESVGEVEGKYFWNSRKEYIRGIEKHLSLYILDKLKFNTKIFEKETEIRLDKNNEILEEDYSKIWGEWLGKEAEFYIKTYDLVANMSKDSFNKICNLPSQKKLLDDMIKKKDIFVEKYNSLQ